ncbi:MAG TPA: gliding motility-associated C-terminal domain-containing protein, partial [Bacteroidetes bacterium]|nr:gliding motility-associated C-terminal domain-containing protein [Bacteroidota bacterium]
STNPSITYHSGTPATPANELVWTLVSPMVTTTYYILATNSSCSDEVAVELTVNTAPTADFTASANICSTDEATIAYIGNGTAGATYTWDFAGGTANPGTGAGPHQVSWPTGGTYTVSLTVEENGCASTAFTQMVTVDEPLATPVISCSGSTSSIEFSWADVPGATAYNVTEVSSPVAGMPGANPNTYIFNGLSPGDNVIIEVEATSAGACGNSSAQLECFAENCPNVMVNVGAVADICLTAATAPFDLSATLSGGAGGGTLTWSGNGITDAATGNFDPSQAAIGSNTITLLYQEGNCTYTGSTDINVYQTPLADMTFQSSICQSDVATISFIGTAEPASIFTWNFDGGTIMSGSGSGPFQISWNTAGTHTISLSIESPDGCTSETAMENISVESPLPAPVISCSSNTTSVAFSWNAIAGATSYDVTFSSGHTGTATSDTSYMVTGLTPGELVEFEVVANGAGLCGNSSVQSSCAAQNCPPVVMSIDAVGNICLSSSTAPINLTYSIAGDTPNGMLTWTGTGVNSSGTFDPSAANLGANLITLTYEEGTCLFTATETINVYETPTASFTANAAVCAGEDLQINYTGTNEPGLIYNWNFDGATVVSGTGAGPYMVNWPTGGNHTVFLSVENADGCTSETFSMDVLAEEPLQTPVINCAATTTSVTFSWNSVPGVVDSTITASQAGVLNGNTYTIDNLSPGTPVNIEITFMGSGGCPAVTAMNACASLDCPNISISVDAVSDFCLGSPSAVQLTETTTGSDGSGTGTWSGNGVVGNMFDPVAAGIGSHVIKYTFNEVACTYADSITVNVFQTPAAGFSANTAICITDAATITFNGTAGANADFVWDFDGGMAIPGVGPGPHQVTWNSPGNKTITLDIDDNGCASNQFSQQVQVDDELVISDLVCSAINTESVQATWSPVAGATAYEVVILSHSTGIQTTTSASYLVSALNPGEEVTFQVTPIGNTICPGVPATTTCNAKACDDITVNILPIDPICLLDDVDAVNLLADIDGAGGAGAGVWSGPGVDNSSSLFDPSAAGEGIHVITYNYEILNCTFTATLEVKVGSPPVADAGEDSSLSCWESGSTIRLGGNSTAVGPSITYEWFSTSGDLPDNNNTASPEVSEPGTYTLVVTDVELGCSSSDEVIVSSLLGMPEPSFSIHPTDCLGESATVSIDNINGGQGPYLFSLNDEPFIETDTFPFLSAGNYSLAVIDAAGCENDTVFSIVPLGELTVDLTANIVGRNHILEGESIQLQALSSIPTGELDSIVWSHPDLLSCDDCLDPMAAPLEETTFMVTLYRNGCEATDELVIYVEYQSPVYVPTAFSPNEDGVNDVFQLYPGPRVTRIKSFMVFDRWGELVSSHEDFAPNDPKAVWDGTMNGQEMTSGVFVWMAEIEVVDGTTKLLKGEVVLMK